MLNAELVVIDVGITRPKSTPYVFYRRHILLPVVRICGSPHAQPHFAESSSQERGPVFKPQNGSSIVSLLLFGRPQIDWKSGVPRLVILRAETEPTDRFLIVPAPFGHIDVEGRRKTVAVKGAPYLGRDLLLNGEPEERRLVGRKADALCREFDWAFAACSARSIRFSNPCTLMCRVPRSSLSFQVQRRLEPPQAFLQRTLL